MKPIFPILALSVLVAPVLEACDPDLNDLDTRERILGEAILRDTLEERGPEGGKLYYARDSKKPYTGWAKRVHDNGQPKTLSRCKEGKPDGPMMAWHRSGQKEAEGTFKDGRLEGLLSGWYENGKKKAEANYKEGKLEELAIEWDESGQKRTEGNFKNGKQDGLTTLWHANGKKAAEVKFRNGKPDGIGIQWDMNGKEIRRPQRDNGIAAGRLPRAEVLELSDALAKNKGVDLTQYKAGVPQYFAKGKYWGVFYEAKVGELFFSISVDDSTGETEFYSGVGGKP